MYGAGISRRSLEPLKAHGETIPIWVILRADRQLKGPTVQSLQRFEHRAIMLTEQALRNVQPIVGVDPDQMRIERGVMDLGKR